MTVVWSSVSGRPAEDHHPFPSSLKVTSADGTLDAQGRLVVAGTTAGHGPYGGFVMARYLLESKAGQK